MSESPKWLPVRDIDKLENLQPGEQLDVFACSPGWATGLYMLYTCGSLNITPWLCYNQQIDKYESWLSEAPTLYFKVPDPPEK